MQDRQGRCVVNDDEGKWVQVVEIRLDGGLLKSDDGDEGGLIRGGWMDDC